MAPTPTPDSRSDASIPLSLVFATAPAVLDGESRLQRFFCRMVAIRHTESRLLDLFNAGLVRGTVHTCLGQEACAVGVVAALDNGHDIVCSNHRGHGHYLATHGDVRGLVAEVMGRPSGVCGGVGGSQHLHRGNFYTNGILGGMPPVATGMAAAEQRLGTGRVVCVFLGDGAMAEGSLYESLNMAGLWKLPILFAVEHNQYAQSTHWATQHAGSLPARAPAFGVPVMEVDGNDVQAVFQAAREQVLRLRDGHGPAMLFMHTYRLGAHSKGDDLRDPAELQARRVDEPIARLRPVLGAGWAAEAERQVQQQVDAIVDELRNEVHV